MDGKRNKNIYLENPINFNDMTRQTRMTNNHDKQLEKRNNDVYNPILWIIHTKQQTKQTQPKQPK